jgi:hypothetical protein
VKQEHNGLIDNENNLKEVCKSPDNINWWKKLFVINSNDIVMFQLVNNMLPFSSFETLAHLYLSFNGLHHTHDEDEFDPVEFTTQYQPMLKSFLGQPQACSST